MPKKYFLRDEPFLRQLYLRVVKRRLPVPDFPRSIQIQTQPGCPAHCIFCPNGRTSKPIPPDPMPDDLFHRIIDEALDHEVERLSPYLMCEPLMDRRIGERIAYITRGRDRVGSKAIVKINSNAALLDDTMGAALLDSGLDRVSFSVHGIVPEVYEKTMVNLKLERVLRNIDRFLERKRDGGYKKPRVRVTMVKTKYLEPQIPEILRYWGARNVGVNLRGLENRCNPAVESAMKQFNTSGWKPFSWCSRLFQQVYILNTGDLALCCVDWNRTTIMGRVSESTRIADIWNGPAYVEIRRRFLSGALDGTLCGRCLKEEVAGDTE